MTKTLTGAALALAGLTLAACGSGGDSDAPPIQVAGPGGSSAAPPATPPTAITYPKAPSSIVSPTEFALLDAIFWDAKGTRIPASDIGLRWLGQPATYGLKIAGVGEGELRQISASDQALQLVGSGGQILMTSLDASQSRGRYTGLLFRWGEPFIAAAFGLPTPVGGISSTGMKAYRPVPQGYNITLDVDFALRRITGTIGLAWADAWGPYPQTIYALTPTTFAAGETSFSIPFDVPGAPEKGQVVGRFTGPNAEEVMVSWRGQVKSPYDDSWETQGGVTVLSSTP